MIIFHSDPATDPKGELFKKIKQHNHVYIEWKSKLQVKPRFFSFVMNLMIFFFFIISARDLKRDSLVRRVICLLEPMSVCDFRS